MLKIPAADGMRARLSLALALMVSSIFTGCVATPPEAERFAAAVSAMEQEIGGVIGVYVIDSQTGRTLRHRANERFATASTFKPLLAAAVLAEVDAGRLSLQDEFDTNGIEIQPYSPVTGELGPDDRISLAELCAAAVSISDNTATNLLFDRVGGPQGLTRFLRANGDGMTRMDRYEVALNTNLRGDPRDTSTPQAIASSYLHLLRSDSLSEASRALLRTWLIDSKTGLRRLRAGLPAHWQVGDKTGYGANGAVNNVAVGWPPGNEPVVIAVLMSWTAEDVATLNAVHARIAALAVELLDL